LALEVDGQHHYQAGKLRQKDIIRDARLSRLGYKVIRATNEEAMEDPIRFSLSVVDGILKSRGRKRTVSRDQLEEMIDKRLLEYLGQDASGIINEERKAYSPGTHRQERQGDRRL
jgi:uncharacterized protein DUF559